MSEVLRDLVVSLSLDGDNFSRNLTSINKQIQEAESEFRRAASGVENFEKSVSGTQSQLSSLQQKLALQQKTVKQYEKALEAANKKLENAYARQRAEPYSKPCRYFLAFLLLRYTARRRPAPQHSPTSRSNG